MCHWNKCQAERLRALEDLMSEKCTKHVFSAAQPSAKYDVTEHLWEWKLNEFTQYFFNEMERIKATGFKSKGVWMSLKCQDCNV